MGFYHLQTLVRKLGKNGLLHRRFDVLGRVGTTFQIQHHPTQVRILKNVHQFFRFTCRQIKENTLCIHEQQQRIYTSAVKWALKLQVCSFNIGSNSIEYHFFKNIFITNPFIHERVNSFMFRVPYCRIASPPSFKQTSFRWNRWSDTTYHVGIGTY